MGSRIVNKIVRNHWQTHLEENNSNLIVDPVPYDGNRTEKWNNNQMEMWVYLF